jgi:uncharacterized protein YfbU (UPF0304 family)
LEQLNPDEADFYSQAREILEAGFQLEYGGLVGCFSDGMSDEQCQEVCDILDMHRMLLYAYENLQTKTGINKADLTFKGFDGNNEGPYMRYADFLINKQDRWVESKGVIDSHHSTLYRYRILLDRWKASVDPLHLTEEDLRRIVAPIN